MKPISIYKCILNIIIFFYRFAETRSRNEVNRESSTLWKFLVTEKFEAEFLDENGEIFIDDQSRNTTRNTYVSTLNAIVRARHGRIARREWINRWKRAETRSERLISRCDQVFSKPVRIECKFRSISLQVVPWTKKKKEKKKGISFQYPQKWTVKKQSRNSENEERETWRCNYRIIFLSQLKYFAAIWNDFALRENCWNFYCAAWICSKFLHYTEIWVSWLQ